MRYRRRQIDVDATQWYRDGDHPSVMMVDMGDVVRDAYVKTPDGRRRVQAGDWIVTTEQGEHWVYGELDFSEQFHRIKDWYV